MKTLFGYHVFSNYFQTGSTMDSEIQGLVVLFLNFLSFRSCGMDALRFIDLTRTHDLRVICPELDVSNIFVSIVQKEFFNVH